MRILRVIIGIFFILGGMTQILGLCLSKREFSLFTKLTEPLTSFIFIIIGINLCEKSNLRNDGRLVYANTSLRTLAILVDGILLLPFWYPISFLINAPFLLYAFLKVLSLLSVQGLYLFFLTKYGATPGKMLVGIIVIKTDLSPVRLKEAFLRSSVDIVFTLIYLFQIFLSCSYREYHSIKIIKENNIMEHAPVWYIVVMAFQQYWMWSEIVVMMFNSQRRAIHDYIAGTIVVVKKSLTPSLIEDKKSSCQKK